MPVEQGCDAAHGVAVKLALTREGCVACRACHRRARHRVAAVPHHPSRPGLEQALLPDHPSRDGR
eukprot:4394314-Prymnesium_polylepis.1